MLDIVNVEFAALFPRQVAPTRDLRKTGDTGFNVEDGVLVGIIIEFFRNEGTWSNK